MASEEDRLRHSSRRKKNFLTKTENDFRGPFKIKPVDPRKSEYKREKLRVEELDTYDTESD